jgi:fermentation-respiration switch protein FrsA (DUF1100 family)
MGTNRSFFVIGPIKPSPKKSICLSTPQDYAVSGANPNRGAVTGSDAMAGAAYPFLPSVLFRRLRGHFDTRDAVEDLRIPVLVVHGSADRLVPTSMGREIYERVPEPREWYEVPGAGHNDVFLVGGSAYFDRLARFVAEVTG